MLATEADVDALVMSPDRTRIAYDSGAGTHVVELTTGNDELVTNHHLAGWVGNHTLLVGLVLQDVP